MKPLSAFFALLSLPLLAAASQTPGAELASRWAAPASVDVATREVTFRNGDVMLSGTIHYPRSVPIRSALVVTHGASSPDRTLPLYRHLTEMLPPLGMAVLVYDRRGSGKSTGELAQSDYEALARDALAGREAVARELKVDRGNIGFWGLSQGGWLAALASSLDPTSAFAISVSAPLVNPDVQMNFATANILPIRGYGEEDVRILLDARRAVDGYLKGEVGAAEAEAKLAAARDKPWFKHVYMSDTLGDPKTSRWLKEMRHDPLQTLKQGSAPLLLIYGAEDPWIPVETSLSRARTLEAAKRFSMFVIPGVDHAMMADVEPSRQIDPEFFPAQAPNSPAYFAILTSWLAERKLIASGTQ